MTDKENLEVVAPEKWMNGWDNYYKKMLEQADEKLAEFLGISHPVQNLARHLFGKEISLQAIDLACGDGTTACFLAKIGCKVDAIDALQSAIELTQKRAEVLGFTDKVSVEKKDIDGWEIPANKYDIVIATQCMQYLFDRAIPRLKEIAEAIKPGGFIVYSGNIEPHFKIEPPMRFIIKEELLEIFKDWTLYSLGTDEILLRPGDLRGYIWIVAKKPNSEE